MDSCWSLAGLLLVSCWSLAGLSVVSCKGYARGLLWCIVLIDGCFCLLLFHRQRCETAMFFPNSNSLGFLTLNRWTGAVGWHLGGVSVVSRWHLGGVLVVSWWGLGGVLVSPAGHFASAFSFCLSASDLSKLGYPSKKTIIFEADLLAVIVSFVLWQRVLKGRPCVAYVDNNGTRDVCISGSARTSPGKELVEKLLAVEDSAGVVSWFARVPSSSNVADGPSRGSCDDVDAKFLSPLLVGIAVSKCLEYVERTNG